MERKVGEVFEYNSKKVEVKKYEFLTGCKNCIGTLEGFYDMCFEYECMMEDRTDNESVIFTEVKE